MDETIEEARRRHIKQGEALSDEELLIALKYGYHGPHLDVNEPVARAILESRLLARIAEQTKELTKINEESKVEIKHLLKSSLVIESLTKWLVGLTVVLGLLTLALVLDVANKFRLEYFSPLPQLS